MNSFLIAYRLKTLRGNRSQEDAAAAVGVPLATYKRYENGQQIPRDEIKQKLAKLYNVPVEMFFNHKKGETICKTGAANKTTQCAATFYLL